MSSRILQKQFQGYKNEDPPEKQQRAVPLSVIRRLNDVAKTELEKAIAILDAGAIYFAMRSCEYLSVPDAKNKRTKLLCIRNFRFFKNNREINIKSKNIANADCVAITFEFQKNDERNETVTQEWTDDPLLCPVKSWANTINRILSYPKTLSGSSINTFRLKRRMYFISSSENMKLLQRTVSSMDKISLGFEPDKIGTHSILSGGAMAIKLSGAEDSKIRLIGRWKSNSFMKYIRKQILQFSSKIS